MKTLERMMFMLSGVNPDEEMDWKKFLRALLVVNLFWFVWGMVLLVAQGVLPLNLDGNIGQFLIVCITLKPFADYTGTVITIASFLSLFVCLIPTTIGGLLSAIGIAGMDRALRANVITKSGKAVETAGSLI